jgi:hypothetical protein
VLRTNVSGEFCRHFVLTRATFGAETHGKWCYRSPIHTSVLILAVSCCSASTSHPTPHPRKALLLRLSLFARVAARRRRRAGGPGICLDTQHMGRYRIHRTWNHNRGEYVVCRMPDPERQRPTADGKSEIRSSKLETNPKCECSNPVADDVSAAPNKPNHSTCCGSCSTGALHIGRWVGGGKNKANRPGSVEAGKSEIRSSKAETSSKSQCSKRQASAAGGRDWGLETADWGFEDARCAGLV